METMLTISRHISSILDIDVLLDKVISEAVELTGAERGMLLLYQENVDNQLKIIASKNISQAEYESKDFHISLKVIRKVEDEKNPILIINAEDDEFIRSNTVSSRGDIKSIICVPIASRSEFLGVLYLDNRLLGGLFTKGELDVINLLAGQAGISIQNADLYRKAVTDSLTGLCNRGYFDNFLLQRTYEAQRYGKTLSLLMMDIDFFKKFNDTYGHVVGDKVLRSVARAMQNLVRKSDLIARYGGEEIVAVLPETDIAGASIVAEKMRKCIEELEIIHQEGFETKILKVTISIGVAALKGDEEKIALIERADLALYHAKAGGRNRVEYDEPVTAVGAELPV